MVTGVVAGTRKRGPLPQYNNEFYPKIELSERSEFRSNCCSNSATTWLNMSLVAQYFTGKLNFCSQSKNSGPESRWVLKSNRF